MMRDCIARIDCQTSYVCPSNLALLSMLARTSMEDLVLFSVAVGLTFMCSINQGSIPSVQAATDAHYKK